MNARRYDSGRRNWNDVATSQEILTDPRDWKKQQMGSPLEIPEGTGLADTLILVS